MDIEAYEGDSKPGDVLEHGNEKFQGPIVLVSGHNGDWGCT